MTFFFETELDFETVLDAGLFLTATAAPFGVVFLGCLGAGAFFTVRAADFVRAIGAWRLTGLFGRAATLVRRGAAVRRAARGRFLAVGRRAGERFAVFFAFLTRRAGGRRDLLVLAGRDPTGAFFFFPRAPVVRGRDGAFLAAMTFFPSARLTPAP